MAPDATYDVFLSHASPDKPAVVELARRLKRRKLKPFLDKWHLVPGEPWQEALEEALDRSQTFAVFLGPGGVGPWQNEEMRDALATRVGDKNRRVIPVLLPGAVMPQERALPRFLRRLTWVDFRSGLDDREAFHRLVSGIKGLPPGDSLAPAPSPSPPTRPTMIGIPHRNPFFTGRKDLLSRLHQQLQTEGISALAQAAIYGLGGIGKTQTAIEYVHRYGEDYRFVLWAMAESETSLRTAYLSIARELSLVEAQADLATAVLVVKAWLSREAGWLLVFDNADNPALVRPYLPSARTGGKVLLTSRAKSFVNVGIREPFRVETFNPKDAVQFLIERTGNVDTQNADALATELGYLPLALEQAAAYIESVGADFPEYLARYRRQGLALFAKGKPSTDYPETVATTWTLSYDVVCNSSPASAELLIVAAFLVPDSVPIEVFTRGGTELGNLLAQELKGVDEDPLSFWELLEPLERYSLVERLPNDAFKLHRLTQEVVKESLGEVGRRAWVERVIRALNAAYPYPLPEFESWKVCERLQPNVKRASDLARTYKLESAEAGRLFSAAGYFAWERGDNAGARLFEELALAIQERVLGSEHPDTLMSRNNLGLTFWSVGDFARARKLHEQTLEIRERVLGGEHRHTLASRNNLGLALRSLGDLLGARKLQENTLEIQERVLGAEHRDTLASRNNLASTLRSLGDFAGSRKLHEQNLEINQRVLGGEHPSTLASSGNLAEALHALGDLAAARKLQEQTLEIRERVLGGEHPHTTITIWSLLQTVRELGDPDAEALLVDKLRWLLDRDEDSIPSADQRTIRKKLLDLLNPS